MNDRELRAPRKHSFKLEYETIRNVLDELSDIELGEYFKAVCNYELFGVIPEDFSDMTVRAMFKVTCRELDYQLEKHKGNQERGRQNRSGKIEQLEEDAAPETYTDLNQVLSVEDIMHLESKLPCVSELIEEVQEQLELNGTKVNNPVRYLLKYAEESDWRTRIEEDMERVATGFYGYGNTNHL